MKSKQPWTQIATGWAVFCILFIALVLCVRGFQWRNCELGVEKTPDSVFSYSEACLRTFFDKIKPKGCRFYAITELTLDMVFPLVYGSLFFILLWKLLDCRSHRKLLLLLPMASVIADVFENLTLSYLALNYEKHTTLFSTLASFSAICTATKWTFIGMNISAIVILVICRLRSRRTSTAEPATATS